MYLKHIRIRPREQTGNSKGQGSLEMVAAIFGVMLLLLGSFAIFIWVSKSLVIRESAYENTQVQAADSSSELAVPEPPALRIGSDYAY